MSPWRCCDVSSFVLLSRKKPSSSPSGSESDREKKNTNATSSLTCPICMESVEQVFTYYDNGMLSISSLFPVSAFRSSASHYSLWAHIL